MLTKKEKEVLELRSTNLKQIAFKLKISQPAVSAFENNAIRKIREAKDCNSNGNIEVGDLLTTSSTPGYAMKCNDKLKCMGAIVGKALEEPFFEKETPGKENQTATIMALITLQ